MPVFLEASPVCGLESFPKGANIKGYSQRIKYKIYYININIYIFKIYLYKVTRMYIYKSLLDPAGASPDLDVHPQHGQAPQSAQGLLGLPLSPFPGCECESPASVYLAVTREGR